MRVQAQLADFLGDRWREADVTVEVFSILPFAVVCVAVETSDDEGFDPRTINYFLLIGPALLDNNGQLPIVLLAWGQDMNYSTLTSWDGYWMDSPESSRDEIQVPGDLLSDALLNGDADGVLNALLGAVGVPLLIRNPEPDRSRPFK